MKNGFIAIDFQWKKRSVAHSRRTANTFASELFESHKRSPPPQRANKNLFLMMHILRLVHDPRSPSAVWESEAYATGRTHAKCAHRNGRALVRNEE